MAKKKEVKTKKKAKKKVKRARRDSLGPPHDNQHSAHYDGPWGWG